VVGLFLVLHIVHIFDVIVHQLLLLHFPMGMYQHHPIGMEEECEGELAFYVLGA
jgi:hypothetical protein